MMIIVKPPTSDLCMSRLEIEHNVGSIAYGPNVPKSIALTGLYCTFQKMRIGTHSRREEVKAPLIL